MQIKVIERADRNYPKKLLKINQPPKKLYVLGNERLLENPSLAIVGSRSCSEYGVKYTTQFSKKIADTGITIISGLAIRN